MAEPFHRLTSRIVLLDQPDIDTDQIVPARFMSGTDRNGFAAALFHDQRASSRDASGGRHVLDRIDPDARRILVAGANFGCGSSREHAVWALAQFGFRVLISTRFADIFRANALNNNLLSIELPSESWALVAAAGDRKVTVDLAAKRISIDNVVVTFAIDSFSELRLAQGWDMLDYLRKAAPQIDAYERRRNPT